MKKVIMASVLTSMSIFASASFDAEKINKNLESFNKEQHLEMKVIGSSPIGKNFTFVVVGDMKANKFMNIVVGDDADIAIAPAQIVPLLQTPEWEKQKNGLENMLASMKKMFPDPIAKELSRITQSVDQENIFYFNGAEKTTDYEIFIIDPKCPHCQEDVATAISDLEKTKKPFAILPLAAFGEDSIDSVIYLLKNSKRGDFESFKKTFKESLEKSATDDALKEKVMKTSMEVFSTGLVRGVPFKYEYSTSLTK